jgi:hypothetical protein
LLAAFEYTPGKAKTGGKPSKMPSCDVQSFLELRDGVAHGLERGLMQAADVAESFDAASEPEGNCQATYRQLTLFCSSTSAIQAHYQTS